MDYLFVYLAVSAVVTFILWQILSIDKDDDE